MVKTPKTRVHLCGHFAVVYPAQRGKVCRLRTVETMIEASVIPIREGDHELPCFLSNLKEEGSKEKKIYWCENFVLKSECVRQFSLKFKCTEREMEVVCQAYLIEGNAILFQNGGRDQSHLVAKESFTAFRAVGEETWATHAHIYMIKGARE